MLARCLSRAGTLFALVFLVASAWGPTAPRSASRDATLENFGGWTAMEFRDWCTAEGVEPVFYDKSTGAVVATSPVVNVIVANHTSSPPGSSVSSGETVGVLLGPVRVEDFGFRRVDYVTRWCSDRGLLTRFRNRSGGVIAPAPDWVVYENETTGEVPVGGTVGVIVLGPLLTAEKVYVLAAVTLLLAVLISVAVSRILARRDR